MKKPKNTKWFTLGIVVFLLASIFIVPAFASTLTKTAQLVYNDIVITLNGRTIIPKDSSGNVVEPLIIDGTTYLPVRAISNALGLSVEWDAKTKTVKLSDGSSTTATGTVVMNKNGLKVTYLGMQPSSSDYGGVDVELLIENNSSINYSIYAENESANDFMIETYYSCDVAAGKKTYGYVNFAESDLISNHITAVKFVEFILCAYDSDTFNGDFCSDIIHIN